MNEKAEAFALFQITRRSKNECIFEDSNLNDLQSKCIANHILLLEADTLARLLIS